MTEPKKTERKGKKYIEQKQMRNKQRKTETKKESP